MEPQRPSVAEADRQFLLDPLASFPLTADERRSERLSSAYLELLSVDDRPRARQVADDLLAVDPGFQPAILLLAQVDFVSGRSDLAADRLEPLVAELPEYLAAQILLAGAYERLGEIVDAVKVYRSAAGASALAADRAEILFPRALEILGNRTRDALSQHQLDAAREATEQLAAWDPDGSITLTAQGALAVAEGDAPAELAALRRLVRLPETPESTVERLGTLELRIGDAGAALEIFQRLAAASPQRADLRAKLDQSKFRWRLGLIPEQVRAQAERPTLSRGGLAALIYWLIPEVRLGRPGAGRIATDVLDHPFRDEIVRTVGLGLLDIDSTLHRFAPGASATRHQTLAAVVGAVALRRESSARCKEAARQRSTPVEVCEAALSCGLIASLAECSVRSQVSGAEALELIESAVRTP